MRVLCGAAVATLFGLDGTTSLALEGPMALGESAGVALATPTPRSSPRAEPLLPPEGFPTAPPPDQIKPQLEPRGEAPDGLEPVRNGAPSNAEGALR